MKVNKIFAAIFAGAVLTAAVPVFAAQPGSFRDFNRDNDRNVRNAPQSRPSAQRPAAAPVQRVEQPRRFFDNRSAPARPVMVDHTPRHFPVARPHVVQRPVYVERPVYVGRPVIMQPPVYVEAPVYSEPSYPYYGEAPVYSEPQYPYYGEVREGPNPVGMAIGAILGAVIGNQVAGHHNGSAGAAVGAVIGGAIGSGM